MYLKRNELTANIAVSACLLIACLQVPEAQAQSPATGPANCSEALAQADESYPFLRQLPLTESPDTLVEIDAIEYSRLRIFNENDPDENNLLFRWANRIHVLTQQSTVEQLLLFEPGEQVPGRLLEESARILRNQNYFYDADLRFSSNCNDRVRVEVITKDNWSLTPNLSIDRSGGDNTYSFGLRESNLLGLGKQLAIERSEDLDRESEEIAYTDPNVLGTWIRNQTVFTDSDDGSRKLFDLALPFYALDSRRSWSFRLEDESRIDAQFFLGEEVSEVKHDIEIGELAYGWSRGLVDARYVRWSAGLMYRRDRFTPGLDLPSPLRFPADRELVYPFLQVALGEDRFVTAFNFNEILRTEDIYLGYRLSARVGYAGEEIGSDQTRFLVEGEFTDTLFYDSRQLWQYGVNWTALLNQDSGHSEDVIVDFNTRYFLRQSERWSFFVRLRSTYTNNLSRERQQFMGGDMGVRAYDNRLQVGDRNVVLSLEERVYTDLHLLNLLRVGGAVFADVGRAWTPGVDSGLDDPWLANVGFGLRLMSSKAASSRIAHLDFAFPVTNRNHPAVDRVQIAFNIKGRF